MSVALGTPTTTPISHNASLVTAHRNSSANPSELRTRLISPISFGQTSLPGASIPDRDASLQDIYKGVLSELVILRTRLEDLEEQPQRTPLAGSSHQEKKLEKIKLRIRIAVIEQRLFSTGRSCQKRQAHRPRFLSISCPSVKTLDS